MQHNMTKEKLDELNTQLRILLLQNVRIEDEYDDHFLKEMNRITRQILDLKLTLTNKENDRKNTVVHQLAGSYIY
jgi:hypothetical protein